MTEKYTTENLAILKGLDKLPRENWITDGTFECLLAVIKQKIHNKGYTPMTNEELQQYRTDLTKQVFQHSSNKATQLEQLFIAERIPATLREEIYKIVIQLNN